MASQSDAALFTEMRQRLDKVEELLQLALDKLQQLVAQAGGDKDMMHEVYPPQDPDEAA